jgi:hypothetical protein
MRRILLLAGLALTLIIPPASAGVRHFTFVYEAPTSAPGSWELENWFTWRRVGDEDADALVFRHEVEYGVTERLQASLYFADWVYQSAPGRSGTIFEDVGLELIYNFSNPVIDPVGFSFYQEYKAGYHLFEWESKAILQKNIGRWILAYNATVEAVWEGEDLHETEGELIQSLGISYEIHPRLSVGLEMVHEFVLPEWKDNEKIRNFFVGPNVSFRHGHWFATTSFLAQATDTSGEPDFQWRTILGIGF